MAGKLKRGWYNKLTKLLFITNFKTMKTTTIRTAAIILSAGILVTSCVSSKKYHRSEAEVAKLRGDSTTLANQRASLQQNLTAEQQKAADLQKSLQSSTSTNTGLQKNVAYYHDYFDKTKTDAGKIKDELNTTLTPSGITNQDIIQVDGKIYVNISENSLFKGKSAVLTAKGKELVSNLGIFVKGHDGVDISVADLQQATDTAAMAMSSENNTTTTTMTSNDNNNSAAASNNNSVNKHAKTKSTIAAADKTAHKSMAVVHHKRKMQASTAGEGKSVAYSANHHNKWATEKNKRSMARATAWKRQTIVADALLKTGISKVKLVSQLPSAGNANGQKGVQVVLVPDINFYKQMQNAPTAGQPVSMNP